jgi:glycosyltransferase involved in cell wall biosynthesis
MAAFFVALKRQRPDSFFLWLTQGDKSIVDKPMTEAGFGPDDYAVRSIAPRDMPAWLNAGDAGVAFYRPGVSRLGTSPVKVSEYLACGLPVVVNSGIGDTDALINGQQIGVLVRAFGDAEYAKAARTIAELATGGAAIRQRARAVANNLFDVRRVGVERYARLYERVLQDKN